MFTDFQRMLDSIFWTAMGVVVTCLIVAALGILLFTL